MTIRSKLLIAVPAVILAAMPAHAGHGSKGDGSSHGKKFEKMDLNGDGAISREEAAESRRKHVMAADTDGDGAVTVEEMKAHYKKKYGEKAEGADGKKSGKVEEHFKKWDADGDGKVTAAEIDAKKSDRFDKWDADGDGKVTKDEMDAAKAKWQEEHKKKNQDGENQDGQ